MAYFYFTAQDGVIREEPPKAPTHFYVYKLPLSLRAQVEAAVNAAPICSGCLEYSGAFLELIGAADRKARREGGER